MIGVLAVLATFAAPPVYVERNPESLSQLITLTSSRATPEHAKLLAGAVSDAGKRFNIDPAWILGLGYAESRWHEKPRSGDKGRSHGIYQMTLGVARSVEFGGVFEDKPSRDRVYRSSAKQRALLGDVWVSSLSVAAYLAKLRAKYGAWADVVYNCGPVRCGKWGGRRMKSTRATRAYWRYYRRLVNRIEKIENQECFDTTGAL